MQNQLEQTLDSREVAEMIEKDHSKLLRDLRRYEEQFTEAKIGFSDFFRESQYKDSTGRALPCYRITKKGCEFIAHKLTGTKGTIFTARYINRFHEMQEIIARQEQEPKLPWFIRHIPEKWGGYVILERDFITLTGVDIRKHWEFYKEEYFRGGYDFNGFATCDTCDLEEFKRKYGFDYGNEKILRFFRLHGAIKAIEILKSDKAVNLLPGAYETLIRGIKETVKSYSRKEEKPVKKPESITVEGNVLPLQVKVIVESAQETEIIC